MSIAQLFGTSMNSDGAVRHSTELTIVAPCFNESQNVSVLVEKLGTALAGVEWEIIFVDDDSPDGTASEVRRLAAVDRRVRCVQRIGRRGLSTAVIEGILASSSPYVAVMDADLQHDEGLLPAMLDKLRGGNLDLVIGSRYVEGGSTGTWDQTRASMSAFATRLAGFVLKQHVRDPMSGFFMLTRGFFDQCVRRLSGHGFKILVDLFASSQRPVRFEELAFTFRERQHGESKLDSMVLIEFVMLLLDKTIGWLVPVRFILFAAVGFSGVFVHFIVLGIAMLSLPFTAAQTVATLVAMTSNFFINNVLTYRDRRLHGRDLVFGLLTFYLVCSVGAVANVGIATAIFEREYSWWLAGLAGILVGVVWNYVMSFTFTWRRRAPA